MRAGWSRKLKNLLHAADPVLEHVAEVVAVLSQDIKELKSDWSAADSNPGFTFRDDGTVVLAESSAGTITGPTDDGTEANDLTHIPPFDALLIEWTGAGAEERELKTLTARLHPRPDGGASKEVAEWRCQLFRVLDWGPDEGDFVASPISKRVDVAAAGTSEGDVTFDFQSALGNYPKVGPPPKGDVTDDTTPFTLVRIWALDSDGRPAGNVAWMADSASGSSISGTGYTVTHYRILDGSEEGDPLKKTGGTAYRIGSAVANMPEFTLNEASFASAQTISFTGAGNRPQGLTTSGVHRIVAQGFEPSDTSITYEIRPAGGGTWLECFDGDLVGEDNTSQGGGDLSSLAKATSYDIRATLTPSSSNLTTPILTRLGVEELTVTDLAGVVTVHGMRHRVDPRTLKGNITSATFRFLRTGERDYRDYGAQVLASNHIGDVELRLWIGDSSGDHLDRSEWMLLDVFEIEDYHTEPAAHVVQAVSPLRRLRTRIPPFVVTSGTDGTRTLLEYTNQTITAVYDDLVDGQVGLPARYRGQGVEDTSLVSKRIADADAKDEMDRLAYLAGHGVISSQGRVKAVRMMTDDGEGDTPVATFEIGQYTPLHIGPGFSVVTDEFFVPFGWDEARNDGRGEFEDEIRYFNATAFTKLGGSRIETTERLDDETARWIPDSTLATAVAKRVPNHFGNGLVAWRIKPIFRHPHLEPGDPVVVVTDEFVARSPVSDTQLRGPLAAHGVVAETYLADGGAPEEIEVWIASFDQIVVSEGDVTRLGNARPKIVQLISSVDGQGNVSLDFIGNGDALSLRYAVSNSTYPTRATVQGESPVALDSTNHDAHEDDVGSVANEQVLFVSALAYELADGTGEEQETLLRARVEAPAVIVPTVRVEPSQSGTTATLTLVIEDPESRVSGTAFDSHPGPGDYDFDADPANWAAVDLTAPFDLSYDATIVGKHNTVIAWGVRYTDATSTDIWLTGAYTFDSDEIPKFTSASLEIVGGTTVNFHYVGDEDLGSVRWAKSTSALPVGDDVDGNAGTGAGAGTVNAGRTSNGGVLVESSLSDTLYFRARGYSDASGGGRSSEEDFTIQVSRVSGDDLPDGSVIAAKLTDQAKTFNTDIEFDPYASNRVSWTAGTLELADGSTYSINSGDSGVISGLTYIYFDQTVSTTTLNVTTNYSTAVGENVVLLAVCKEEAAGNGRAFLVTGVGVLGINEDVLGANAVGTTIIRDDAVTTPKLVANAVTANKIQSGSVTTAKLAAGAVETDKLAANSVTAAKINVVSLSAISADIGTVTAGLLQNAAGTRFIDLDASGTSAFIKHDNFELLADGSASFGGTVSAEDFTGTRAVFDGEVVVKAGETYDVFEMASLFFKAFNSAGGTRLRIHGGGVSGVDGIIDSPTSGLQLRAGGIGDDVQLDPGSSGGVVHFAYSKTTTSKTAQAEWLEVKVDAAGNTRFLRLYS